MLSPTKCKYVLKGIVFSIFFCFSITNHLYGQERKKMNIKAPTCILFKINRSENKIASLLERNRQNEVEELRREDERIAAAIMEDFKYNFQFCKVYFFNGPELNLVKEKKWSDVSFFDQNLVDRIIPPDSLLKHVFIVELNYPPPPINQIITTSDGVTYQEPQDMRTYLLSDIPGLVTYDANYVWLNTKFGFVRPRVYHRRIARSPQSGQIVWNFGVKSYDRLLRKYFRK